MHTIILPFVFALSFFMLSSCATRQLPHLNTLFAESGETDESDTMSDYYLLGPDDVIKIVVEQHPEWSGEFTIGPNGNIMVHGVGDIYAEGLIKDDFAAIFSAYLEKFIRNPRVSLDIITYASQAIYVLGHVRNPGKYLTEGKTITLRDAVIQAGLPLQFAALSRIFVISASRKNPSRRVVNLYRILYRGELKKNITLKPGDIVFIPRTFIGAVVDFLSGLLSPLNSVSSAQAVMAAP